MEAWSEAGRPPRTNGRRLAGTDGIRRPATDSDETDGTEAGQWIDQLVSARYSDQIRQTGQLAPGQPNQRAAAGPNRVRRNPSQTGVEQLSRHGPGRKRLRRARLCATIRPTRRSEAIFASLALPGPFHQSGLSVSSQTAVLSSSLILSADTEKNTPSPPSTSEPTAPRSPTTASAAPSPDR